VNQKGDPLVGLDLHDRQARRDDAAVPPDRPEAEIPVPPQDPAVEGDPQAQIGIAPEVRRALMTGDRCGTRGQAAHQPEDLLGQRSIDSVPLPSLRIDSAVVAEHPGPAVRPDDPALLGDLVDPLSDLH
jgi:hypothetical protein